MSFSVLESNLILLRESPRRGGLSSLLHDVTRTVGVCPGSFFIRRSYYTFVNRLINLYTLKNSNSFLKSNRPTIKSLCIGLFRPAVRHTV